MQNRHNPEVPHLDPTQSVREYNRDRVIAALEGVAAISRSELVERTGLSRTTVTAIVGELLRVGIIREVPHPLRARTTVGRRPTYLALVRDRGFGVAVDIGHEILQVAVADRAGRILAHQAAEIPEQASATVTVARVVAAVARLLTKGHHDMSECSGIVAAIPEPVDRDGQIARAAVRTRWRGHNPATLLSDALDFPVHVENDANLAVVGEAVFGIARGYDDVIYAKIAHGIGSGIIANGRLVRGGRGLAGEIGHTQVREDGVVCACGNRGCLYTLVTAQYLAQLLFAVTNDSRLGLPDLVRMGRRGHSGAGRVLADAGRECGKALANLCNTLNPSVVVVGGALAHAGPWLLDGLRESMARYAEAQVAASFVVHEASLEERAELYGAIAMAVGIIDRASGGPARPLTTAEGPPAGAALARPTAG